MQATIVLLPGDGIGPEIVREARLVLETVAKKFSHTFTFTEHLIGGCAIDATGEPLPAATTTACQAADAILLGAVGGPKWDDPQAKVRPEGGLLAIRKALGLYANLRPVRVHPALAAASPLKADRVEGVDVLFVRELTGGLYFGTPKHRDATRAVDTLVYTADEIQRIVRLAFELARGRKKKVTSVDKANVLESSRLWREIAVAVGKEYPDVELEHQLVDSCAMRIITGARTLDVVVTENMFGDILTDEAAVLPDRPPAECVARHGQTRSLRADQRLRARHRGQGRRKSDRYDRQCCDAAAPLAGAHGGSRCGRACYRCGDRVGRWHG